MKYFPFFVNTFFILKNLLAGQSKVLHQYKYIDENEKTKGNLLFFRNMETRFTIPSWSFF